MALADLSQRPAASSSEPRQDFGYCGSFDNASNHHTLGSSGLSVVMEVISQNLQYIEAPT